MSTLPGRVLAAARHDMSDDQYIAVLRDAQKCAAVVNSASEIPFPDADGEWRALTRPDAISDLDGERCLTFPFLDNFWDAPVHVESFVEQMSLPASMVGDPASLLRSTLSAISPRLDTIEFCHLDLHSCNILVDQGRLSGVVDWELAGWYAPALDHFSALRQEYLDRSVQQLFIRAWGIESSVVNASSSMRDIGKQRRGWASMRTIKQASVKSTDGGQDPGAGMGETDRKKRGGPAIDMASQPAEAMLTHIQRRGS
jgi:hypothetical protein